ncbi:hypothetical protein [Streptomyces sp. NPDC046261]|uniref:linalool dehydratase/isomerase domain-containing protein n=1 Tax=Streptomyces sp. NPDC046261 TaxID=3157200 RepID=UPI0033F6FBDE
MGDAHLSATPHIPILWRSAMEKLIKKMAQDDVWRGWVAANSATAAAKDGCISVAKSGCISVVKTGCIS